MIGEGASSIFMGGLCFGRDIELKGEGKMRSEEKWWGSEGSTGRLTKGSE